MAKSARDFSEAEREAVVMRLKLLPGDAGKRWREIFHRLHALKEAEARRKDSIPYRVKMLSEIDRDYPPRSPK